MYPGITGPKYKDKPAVHIFPSGRTVSHEQLDWESNRLAHLLRKLGVNYGENIALLMNNNEYNLSLSFAAIRSGSIYTPVSYRLQKQEVEHIINDSGAKVIFASAKYVELIDSIENIPGVLHKVLLEPDEYDENFAVTRKIESSSTDNWLDYFAVREQLSTENLPDERAGTDMLYSSGTTGKPKGIEFNIENLKLEEPNAVTNLMQFLYQGTDESIYLCPAPLYHAAPLKFTLAMLSLGSTVVVMEKFDPLSALACIEKYKITHSQWVPTMFIRMLKLDEQEKNKYDLSTHKVAIHAAAPCPVHVKEQMINWWGNIVYEYYAGSEGIGFTAINSDEWMNHKGSVGRAVIGVVHILDEDFEELPPGEIGGVYFESDTSFRYKGDEEKTKGSRSKQGWTTLGDIGTVDEEGYLYLKDRKSFMIISGGVNIYPQQIEDLLVAHEKVIDAAVFGIPDPEFGEQVKAAVQCIQHPETIQEQEQLEEQLKDYCKAHLSHLICPKSFDFEKELPRHPTGKLYKRLLKDKYWKDKSLVS